VTIKYFNVKNGLLTGNITLNAGNGNVVANTFVGNLSVTGLANLGSVSNVKIQGGSTGQVLSTDGTGNLSWVTQSGGGGGETGNIVLNSFNGDGEQTQFTLTATPTSEDYTTINIDGVSQLHTSYTLLGNIITFSAPPASGAVIEVMTFNMGSGGGTSNIVLAGSNTQIQFNDNGNLGASTSLTFNKSTNTFSTGNIVANNISITGNILPTVANVYSLGSESLYFKDVYIGPGSLYINGQKVLEQAANTIVVSADLNQSVRLSTSGTGRIELLPTGTGVIQVDGTLQINGSKSIISDNGSKIKFGSTIGVDALTTNSDTGDLNISGSNTGNVRVNDDLVVTGNLTVQGNTANLSVTHLVTQDNIIEINAEVTGTPNAEINSGIRVLRGDLNPVQLRWNELLDRWQVTNDTTNYITLVGTDDNGNILLGNNAFSNNLVVSGNGVFGGNLTVNGNLTYINVDTLRIQDPVIELGSGANGNALTTNDGKDRGTLLHYYTTQPVNAFMGWDNSNSEFAFGSNVTISDEVVTFNSLGNVRANHFIGNGSQLTDVAALTAQTVITNAQPNITSVGLLTSLSVGPNSSITLTGTTGFVRANSIQGIDGVNAIFPAYNNVSGSVGIQTDLTIGVNGTGNLVANAGKAIFGNANSVVITGGTSGQVLSTDGTGNLSWITQSGGSASISVSSNGNVLTNTVSSFNFTGNGVSTTNTGDNVTVTINSTAGGGASVSVSETAPVSPTNGDLWLDSSSMTLYIYYTDTDGSQWVQVSDGDSPVINSQVLANFNTREYTGDGNTTQFTVSSGLYESGVIVTENGILQLPTVDYTIADTTLTFTTAPASNVQIQIREIAFTNIWQEVTTTTYQAVKGQKLFVDCSSANVTVTLPALPVMGDEVTIVDATGTAATNNITVDRNGNKITGLTENLTIDINDAAITLAYYNSARGWLVVNK
jgi:hypothetical protein